MEPMRRRLAQLELALVLNAEATYSLLEHIQELRRTLQAAAEAGVSGFSIIIYIFIILYIIIII